MSVLRVTSGPMDTNCYLVGDSASGEALIVDAPWGVLSPLLEKIRVGSWHPIYLVLTHGHWDHVAAASDLRAALDVAIAAHRLEGPALEAPAETLYQVPFEIPSIHADRLLEDGATLDVGALRFHILHTPGHSPGAICLYEPDAKLLLSGDTLFHNGYGRTDLPGADEETLWRSLTRLSALPDDVRILPGHGVETTIGTEAWMRRIPADL